MDMLKEPDTQIRITVISIVVTHHRGFSTERLAKDFLPALLKEMVQCDCYTSNWMLENYASIVEFVVDRHILRAEHFPTLENFLQVLCCSLFSEGTSVE